MKTPNSNPGSVQPGINDKCPYCGMIGHMPMVCPRVLAFEFNPDGSVKRVEFVTPAQPALLHPCPQPQRSGLLVPAPGIATATSSDDSPAPTDKRPWPKVTWVQYNNDGTLRAVDIADPSGEHVTCHAAQAKT